MTDNFKNYLKQHSLITREDAINLLNMHTINIKEYINSITINDLTINSVGYYQGYELYSHAEITNQI